MASTDASIKQTNTSHDPAGRRQFVRKHLADWNAKVDPETRAYKFKTMKKEGPFAFYRATAHLYYHDLVDDTGAIAVPSEWVANKALHTWLVGDCHTQNLGFFDVRGDLIYGVNDFDESFPGPFYWDVLRYVASIYLLCPDLSPRELDDAALLFVRSYRAYFDAAASHVPAPSNGQTDAAVRPALAAQCCVDPFKRTDANVIEDDVLLGIAKDLHCGTSNDKLLDKWTEVDASGSRKFKHSKKLAPLDAVADADMIDKWGTYVESVTAGGTKPFRFLVKDRAVRLKSGLGSLGINRKYYILLEEVTSVANGSASTTLPAKYVIVEAKEQLLPTVYCLNLHKDLVPADKLPAGAERYTAAVRSMSIAVDDEHLGTLQGNGRSFVVRRISHCKRSIEKDDLKSVRHLHSFLDRSARSLAASHVHHSNMTASPAAVELPDCLGPIAAFLADETTLNSMVEIGKKYAEQAKADYDGFVQDLKSGLL